MIIKYLSFLIGLIWSYSFIKAQSVFSNKTALLFKFFISKISWLTFILALYYGFKNFSFITLAISAFIAITLVHLGFYFLVKYLKDRFGEENVLRMKSFFEYFLIIFVIYYIFN